MRVKRKSLLDSFAMLAFLNEERGAEKVVFLLRTAEASAARMAGGRLRHRPSATPSPNAGAVCPTPSVTGSAPPGISPARPAFTLPSCTVI